MRRPVAIAVFLTLLAGPAFLLHPTGSELAGQVLDDRGPVVGATVRYQGRPFSTHTDGSGRFRLPRDPRGRRITAAREGYYIAGVPADAGPLVLRLTRLPEGDCEGYSWRAPTPDPTKPLNCGNCHAAIHAEWAAGGHARSSTGKHFRDLYDDLLKEHPDGAGVCASCHAPTAPQADFDLREAVKGLGGLSGVHCDFCHKVAGPGAGEFGLAHGHYNLRLLRPGALNRLGRTPHDSSPNTHHASLVFGPLDDVDRGEDAFSRFQRDSRLCAACHEGTVFGVPVYSTYSEWQQARPGKSCQACHMAPTGSLTNVAPGRGGIERDPPTLGNHRFFDGGQLDMLRKCLKLEVKLNRNADGVVANVSVTAEDVGHRVPTGFIDRQIILVLEPVRDASRKGPVLGPTLPEYTGPSLAGKPGRLYAKVLRDPEGKAPAPFWRADPDSLIDTRLQPGVPDANVWTFPPDTTAVRVRLLHRRFWESAAAVKGWAGNEHSIVDRRLDAP